MNPVTDDDDCGMGEKFGTASDPVNKPNHYHTGGEDGIECIDIIRKLNYDKDYFLGNAMKYLFRCKVKGDELEDLKKCRKYLDWKIEILEMGNGE